MNIPPIISWTLVILGLLLAVSLAYHEVRIRAVIAIQERDKLLDDKKKAVVRPQRVKLTADDRGVIWNLNMQMESLHGHDDNDGITADYQNNIDTDMILERKCTRCGKPRNRQGGFAI